MNLCIYFLEHALFLKQSGEFEIFSWFISYKLFLFCQLPKNAYILSQTCIKHSYLARRSLCEIINSTLGMLIHRWIGGTLFRTCIKLKSEQRETVVHLSLRAFRKCVQKWGYVYFFKNKWNGLPTFQFWIEAALFSAILWRHCFLKWLLAGFSQIYLLLSKALLDSLLCFNCLLIFWGICYKKPLNSLI